MKVFKDTTDQKVFVTLKIDGVKGICVGDRWVSRAGKPLYNLPKHYPEGEYEIYLGNFKDSISAVKTYNGALITDTHIFKLGPHKNTDERLTLGFYHPSNLSRLFQAARKYGYEGLVIYDSKGCFKIKDKITLDVEVIGKTKGTGQYTGSVGALIVRTDFGTEFKVGSGLTKRDRLDFSISDFPIGNIVEVEGMELLPSGKLRHPRFVRLREDLK